MESNNEAFNIVDLFFEKAKGDPHKAAIIFRDKSVSFGGLAQQIDDTANYFLHKGITKGDRVLVFVPMSIDLYRIVLALFKIGATAVFLDEWVSKQRMEVCCKLSQCKAFIGIFKARLFSLFSSELRRIPVNLGTGYKVMANPITIPFTHRDDTALITFTTGSTGVPKAALRTHGFLYHQFKALELKLDPKPEDISMTVLPIVLLINLASGTTSVIASFKASKPDTLKPESVVKQLNKYAVNTIIASPFFVKGIAEYASQQKLLLNGIVKIFTGGAPVFPSEAKVYNEAFSYAKIEIVYGSTEAEPISAINVKHLLQNKNDILKGLNVGRVDPNATVKIISIVDDVIDIKTEEDLSEVTLTTNTVGEIIVSGNHVLRSYLHNPEALQRNKIFIGNACWHRTGDSGYLDASGTLYLTGRCSGIIHQNGREIYPFVYENYLQSIPGVAMGTVLLNNNVVTAVVELNAPDLKTSVEQSIRSGDAIQDIIFLKKLPRDPRHNSKIDYGQLANLLQKQ